MLGERQLNQNQAIAACDIGERVNAQRWIARLHRSKHNQQKASMQLICQPCALWDGSPPQTMQTL
ncbi:hypothetical protein BK652_01930 [Pseudomonas brassicacearum]|uniref:Uncharacterized protein n=1 Tax=Pseudomonas brassicacearum TaxID=930166 RepID=A0A423GGP7_9PSED|nr:hypothetical protein BK652_01930 [Pseudomonas brassicacearum]